MIKTNKNSLDFKLILFIIVLYTIHILIINIPLLSGSFGLLEFLAAIYLFIRKKIAYLLIYLLIVISGTFDVPAFVTGTVGSVVYTFLFLPVVKGYLFYLLICLPGIYIFSKLRRLKHLKTEYKQTYTLLKWACWIPVIGFMMGLIGILINDNNITHIDWPSYFVKDLITISSLSLFVIYFCYQLLTDDKFYLLLRKAMIAILISLPICAIVSILLKLNGWYGTEEILLVPLTLFFAPLIICFAFYKEYDMKWTAIFICLICIVLQFKFSNALGGKSWLSILYLLLAIFIITYQRGKKKILLFTLFCILGISGITMNYIQNKASSGDSLSSGKLTQAVLLLSVVDPEWYINIPSSPKQRIEEFLNIIEEYKLKPLYIIEGKGFAGSIKDHRNSFGSYLIDSFSEDQYSNNSFIILHETVNTIFLKFGLLGLICLIIILKRGVQTFRYSPWGIIGCLWLLFFFGYSISLGIFGVSALTLSCYDADNYKLNSKKKA